MLSGAPASRGVPEKWPHPKTTWTKTGHMSYSKSEAPQKSWAYTPPAFFEAAVDQNKFVHKPNWANMAGRPLSHNIMNTSGVMAALCPRWRPQMRMAPPSNAHQPSEYGDFDLKLEHIRKLCTTVKERLKLEPPVMHVPAPVKIFGDIHGQYSDLLRLFEMGGFPPNANYLFLGDYVDHQKRIQMTSAKEVIN